MTRKIPGPPLVSGDELLIVPPVFAKEAPRSVADLLAIEEHLAKLTEKVVPCTVGLKVGRAQGSGVIISPDGYVLTAAHVAGQPGRRVTLMLPDGREVKGETLGMNRGLDAGLVRITEEGTWPFVEMAPQDSIDVGEWCLATGHPNGYQEGREPVLRLGRVVLVRSMFIQTDCPLVGGDSGGPLLEMEGRVIGVNSRIGTSTAWNFHVPIAAYTDDWERLAAGEAFGGRDEGGAVLGVTGEDDPDRARVRSVIPGFPAEKAGLQAGDIIAELDGKALESFEQLAISIRRKKPGDKVVLTILRSGEEIERTIILAAPKAVE